MNILVGEKKACKSTILDANSKNQRGHFRGVETMASGFQTPITIMDAMKNAAGSRQTSCIISECTRGLGKISSETFYDHVFQFLDGNRDTLINTVIKNNKNKNISDESIRNKFLSILQ
jgi:hypothetical protein